jgi:hypothetical protein
MNPSWRYTPKHCLVQFTHSCLLMKLWLRLPLLHLVHFVSLPCSRFYITQIIFPLPNNDVYHPQLGKNVFLANNNMQRSSYMLQCSKSPVTDVNLPSTNLFYLQLGKMFSLPLCANFFLVIEMQRLPNRQILKCRRNKLVNNERRY